MLTLIGLKLLTYILEALGLPGMLNKMFIKKDISVLKPSKRWVEEVVKDNEKLEKERNGAADVDDQPKIS